MRISCVIKAEQAYVHTSIISALGLASSWTAEACASDGVGRPVGLPTGWTWGRVSPYHTELHNRIILMSINRQINMDYSLCKALSYNMEDMPLASIMYDIMFQYGMHLKESVEKSPRLSIPDSLEL